MDLFSEFRDKIRLYTDDGINYEINMFFKENKLLINSCSSEVIDNIYCIGISVYDQKDIKNIFDEFVRFIKYNDFNLSYCKKTDSGAYYQFITANQHDSEISGFAAELLFTTAKNTDC